MQKVRLATACERAGLPMEGIAAPGQPLRPRCLDAFLALMAERGHRPGSGDGDAAVADAAAEACHDQPQAAEAAATPPVSSHR